MGRRFQAVQHVMDQAMVLTVHNSVTGEMMGFTCRAEAGLAAMFRTTGAGTGGGVCRYRVSVAVGTAWVVLRARGCT